VIRRWLTRRSRVPAILRLSAALILGAAALIGFAAPSAPGHTTAPTNAATPGVPAGSNRAAPDKAPDPPGPGNPTKTFPTSPALVTQGFALYQDSCASCHGLALNGQRGVAPSLRDVGPGPVDFYLSTGRMPLQDPRDEPVRGNPEFNRTQIDALIAYISRFGGPAAPTAHPANGNLALGLHEFTLNCAGCHQIVARGGITVGAQAPDLQEATAQEIAEAVRMGPYLMPHFDSGQIDQHQLDSLARYVIWTRHPDDAGGWGIDNIGPIPEGIVAWFLALASMVLVARLIGERLES
jgi:ubiquinol-cytochrome c reductase cytochrome c subunit